jgi:hypothetical protein
LKRCLMIIKVILNQKLSVNCLTVKVFGRTLWACIPSSAFISRERQEDRSG